MIFNGTDIKIGNAEVKKYNVPVLNQGDEIKLLFDDQSTKIPGCRQLKKGIFKVLKVRESYVTKGLVYELQKRGAKYVFGIHTCAIDMAIDLGLINKQ